MAVISPFILTINNSSYDLRKVVSWWVPADTYVPAAYAVRFQDSELSTVLITQTVFDAQMQLALNSGSW